MKSLICMSNMMTNDTIQQKIIDSIIDSTLVQKCIVE